MADSGGANVTAIGALIGLLIGLAPRILDVVTGRKRERNDEAATYATSAGVLTDAAMKLVEQYQEDAAAFRQGEARCRVELAEVRELHRIEIADVRAQLSQLQRLNGLPVSDDDPPAVDLTVT